MRRVGCINFESVPRFNFFKVQVVCEAVHLSPWEIFVRKLSSVFLKHKFVRALLLPTFSYKTYACKYLHLCPTLLPKFNSTHVKNLRYSICIIACVGRWLFFAESSFRRLQTKENKPSMKCWFLSTSRPRKQKYLICSIAKLSPQLQVCSISKTCRSVSFQSLLQEL